MQFPAPLLHGTLIQRYKRFLADVRLESGETVTATCPNTGSMIGLTTPGLGVWLSTSDSPTRKYRHTWEMVEVDLGKGPSLVGINTGHPNKLVADAITQKRIARLTGYETLKREVKYGKNSRIDILLEDVAKGLCYVEIKNVHMMRKSGFAEFPDSVTERGVKHLAEMTDMVRQGHRAVMVYLVQRADAKSLSFARDIDPTYAAAYDAAIAGGVEAIAVRCRLSPDEITVDKEIPIKAPAKTAKSPA
jgi:sugar fermentation stimulation protein A